MAGQPTKDVDGEAKPHHDGAGARHTAVIRILILEDVPEDAELEQRVLSRAGVAFEAFTVDDRAAFLHALETFKPDLIIADYNLPDIDGLTAIRLVRERDEELPILLVTGALDDEAAAEVVKAGAYDYLRKDRMSRLPLAVEHALAVAETTKARQAAARMEAIGELTAGVAHDFNNLLQAIISHLELVDDVSAVPVAAREYVGNAIEIAEHGAELIHKLLSFARKHVMRPSEIQPAEFLAGFRDMLSHTLNPRIRLETSVGKDLPPILADATHLHTALLNLAINARDAMPSGGDLRIEAVGPEGADFEPRRHPRHGHRQWYGSRCSGQSLRAVLFDQGAQWHRPGPVDGSRLRQTVRR